MVEKDGVKTAICPVCVIDTLLGDACVEISADLDSHLRTLNFDAFLKA